MKRIPIIEKVELNEDELIFKTNEIEIKQNKNSLSISRLKKDYSLNNLRQKLINYLYNLTSYDNNDIELLKILFNDLK